MRQAFIGVAASYVNEQADFEAVRDHMERDSLRSIVYTIHHNYKDYSLIDPDLEILANDLDRMMDDAQQAAENSYVLSYECNWENMVRVLGFLLDPTEAYLGEKHLSAPDAFAAITYDNVILLQKDSCALAEIANYTGNYNAFTTWKDGISIELQTASNYEPLLPKLELLLENSKAAVGGWTRSNLDDLYGFAVDLAFRCNASSNLLLQTDPEMRTEDDSEFLVTGGGGSQMRFLSENMDNEQLIKLMDTIRVGFISDSNELLGVAKLGSYAEYEPWEDYTGDVMGWLYLYDFTLEESGKITIGARKKDAAILELSQNCPVIVSVVVWLDGDHVDNSMVGTIAHQSMVGTLNLQFSSSADLIPSQQLFERD